MFHWVVYDITNNRLRSKVANVCKNYGLKRVQKSAFLGEITKNKIEMLSLEIKEILNNNKDCVFIFPSCDSCFSNKIINGALNEESIRKRPFFITGSNNGKTISDSN